MSWEASFIKKAALEKMKEDGVLAKSEKEEKEPEGVTVEPKNEKAKKEMEREAREEVNEGSLNRD